MKSLEIYDWTINISKNILTLRENRQLALFDNEKNYILFITFIDNGNLELMRCTTSDIKVKVEYDYKSITIILL